jgi:hypothetical protein
VRKIALAWSRVLFRFSRDMMREALFQRPRAVLPHVYGAVVAASRHVQDVRLFSLFATFSLIAAAATAFMPRTSFRPAARECFRFFLSLSPLPGIFAAVFLQIGEPGNE